MLDQAVCQRIGILPRNGKEQKMFQGFMLRKAFQTIAFHPRLHPGPMCLMQRLRFFGLCHVASFPSLCFVPGETILPYPIIIHVSQTNEKSEVIL